MKNLRSVEDVVFEDVRPEEYDLFVFCSGFEKRCTYIPTKLSMSKKIGERVFILGFEEDSEDPQRVENDRIFESRVGGRMEMLSGSDDGLIFDLLSSTQVPKDRPLNVFVDISSMSRVWYAAILNWLRFACVVDSTAVFSYSIAEYSGEYPHRVINSIRAIPGCEGYPDPTAELLAIFGLGFDGISPLAVLDDLEPNDVLAFAASRMGESVIDDDTKRANEGLLELCRECVLFPLLSVQKTYAGLLEMVSPHIGKRNVVLIPLGPKSHVLGAILVSITAPEVECLHVAGPSSKRMYAPPSGQMALAKVKMLG